MKHSNSSFSLPKIGVTFGVAVTLAFAALLSGQAQIRGIGFPEDWSQRHLVFSNPGTFREAVVRGEFDQWASLANDPRFRFQQMKRAAMASSSPKASTNSILDWFFPTRPQGPPATLHRDWNVSLGVGGTVGSGNYPAKYNFNDAASCSDFVVFNTSLAGASAQATLVAFTNLYTGCTTTPPSVAWAYNTTTGDKIVTSVVLSPSGNQVAFISTDGSSHAWLNVLFFQSGQGTAAATPVSPNNSSASGSTYSTCKTTTPTQSCLLRVQFANTANDTTSSPYYDYSGSDTLWVGDAIGKVHKFTGVFAGSPSESGSPWASTANTVLTSPVYDGTHVFVGGANGIMYSILASTAVTTPSAQIAAGLGITDAPIVDATAGKLYVSVGDDRSSSCFGSICSGVFQFSTSSLASSNEVKFGSGILAGTTTIPVYSGTFDNIYFNSGPTTGNLILCSNSGTNTYLVQVPTATFGAGNAFGSYIQVASGSAPCSPVSEILSGGTDWVFLSVAKSPSFTSGSSSSCSGKGCVYNVSLGNGTTLNFASSPSAGFGVTSPASSTASGSSGIIVDNSTTSGSPTGAKIYFTPTNNGTPCASGVGCAVQVSQSTLN